MTGSTTFLPQKIECSESLAALTKKSRTKASMPFHPGFLAQLLLLLWARTAGFRLDLISKTPSSRAARSLFPNRSTCPHSNTIEAWKRKHAMQGAYAGRWIAAKFKRNS